MPQASLASILLVGLGGAVGSIARYLMSTSILHASSFAAATRFPLGTLCVNLLGCLLIGIVAGLAARYEWFTPSLRLLLMTGMLGGFTTFSAFGLETVELLQRQQWLFAGLYVIASVGLGLAAVWLGLQATRLT